MMIGSMRDEMFGFGDPWLPTLLDIERFKAEDSRPEYWQKFGWDQLEIPEDCPYVSDRMTTLSGRFIANYGWRMLAYETMEQWQTKLQERMDAIVHKYNRAYQIYSEHAEDLAKVLPGETRRTNGTVASSGDDVTKASGQDSISSKSKASDTPDSAINESDNYAGSIGVDSGTTTYGRTDTLTHGRTDTTDMTSTLTKTGMEIMEAVNGSIDGWRDIDTQLIREFENLFLNLFWA